MTFRLVPDRRKRRGAMRLTRAALIGVLLAAGGGAAARGQTAFVPVPAAEAVTTFRNLCLNGPENKPAFLAAVTASPWGFEAWPKDPATDERVAPDGRWRAAKGTVTAVHAEPMPAAIIAHQCILRVSPTVGADLARLEQAATAAFAGPPTARLELPTRVQLTWTDHAFDERYIRQISIAHIAKDQPEQELMFLVTYEPRKTS